MERTISISMGKGSLAHNNMRFVAENVDKDRIKNNVIFCQKNIKDVYHKLFDRALQEYNGRQKRNDRKIDDYYEKIRQSRQEKLFYEMIVQIGNREDMSANDEEMSSMAKEVLSGYMEEFQERNPDLYVFNAVLHMDEATPHLHINFVPFITDSKRGLSVRNTLKGALAAQGFVGAGKRSSEWNRWTDSEKEALAGIMEQFDIGWKQLGTREEHLSVYDYKKKKRKEEVHQLEIVITDKNKELAGLEHELENAVQEVEENRKTLDEYDRRIDNASDILDGNARRIAEQFKEIDGADKRLEEMELDLANKRKQRDKVLEEYNLYKEAADRKQIELECLDAKRTIIGDDIAGLNDEKLRIRKKIAADKAELSGIKGRIEKAEGEADVLAVRIIEMQAESDEQKKIMSDYKTELDRVKSVNRQMAEMERRLSGEEWNLPEPGRFMSVK